MSSPYQALELNPQCAEAHMHLFNLYSVHLHNRPLADRHLELANKLEPNNAAAAYTRGTQYFGVCVVCAVCVLCVVCWVLCVCVLYVCVLLCVLLCVCGWRL